MQKSSSASGPVTGEFVTLHDERYYAIGNCDKMPPFFISLVSDADHWLFIASNGGLTAGRVSPETALFPYVTVDRVYDSVAHTGSKTLLRMNLAGNTHDWEPFNTEHDRRYAVTRNLYKNVLGNKLLFEEINHDLQLTFRYRWVCSDRYGFARQCELENHGSEQRRIEVLDGLQNLLPAGTPRYTQNNASYLVDAYKWSELDEQTGLAFYTLYSGISDRAEPSESLKATTVFALGLEDCRILLCAQQIEDFRNGAVLTQETQKRGVRGAYLVNTSLDLPAQSSRHWQLVANIEQSQGAATDLLLQLDNPAAVSAAIEKSVQEGSDALARIMAAADGFQVTAEESVTVHHYANVLFNTMRGGIFDDQYTISSRHFAAHVSQFNADLYAQHESMLKALPDRLGIDQLLSALEQPGDAQLMRLGYEYLPITFGRRHGDPSRPWNEFAIKLVDENGGHLLSYQGNWRDIFQNWEALLLSYPQFIESVIAKFVNASTVDGYNPYRVTNEGIDWEVEEPDDPWSYIGYWGDHQIIYLQKLLELSQQFHPGRLADLLRQPIFSYANVPYKIKPFDALLRDAKSTVVYDKLQEQRIEERVAELGADGKLVLKANNRVYQVNLLEKLLVPLLAKLGNLVVEGGIWLNTQRPEWNDANNALVGQGLSMVTLYYLRRHLAFLRELLACESAAFKLSREVSQWLIDTAQALADLRSSLGAAPLDAGQRYRALADLGEAASRYRQSVYEQEFFTGFIAQDPALVLIMLDDALLAIDHSIRANRREDGLYHAYNLLEIEGSSAAVDTLYPMLEGQVAALSSGVIAPDEAVELLQTLFDSDLFRPDQSTFLLYPDRELPGFLTKNRVPAEQVAQIPLLNRMLEQGEYRIIERDAAGTYRFNAELTNAGDLNSRLHELAHTYGEDLEAARQPILALYEQVFEHRAFTGRSGGMFGFEGLGSIYWHMVSKLLLAIQENFFVARQRGAAEPTLQALGNLYYRVRQGLGFNKSPLEYGAFPMDPYSHTPGHLGAQQPGMTGQVKEEILSRFGELGVRINGGVVTFEPGLLREGEFLAAPGSFRFLDVHGQWQELALPKASLAFSWCQVPLIYRLEQGARPQLNVSWDDGKCQELPGLTLPRDMSQQLFLRSGRVRRLEIVLANHLLFAG